jgi:putative FmdB family regulatory protein
MPTYEYRCAKCGEHLEVYQSFSEAPLTKHQQCGGKLAKVLSPAGIVLKGSGFYKTDNRGGKSRTAHKESSAKESSSDSKASTDSSTSSSDSKSSSSSDTKSTKSDAKSA